MVSTMCDLKSSPSSGPPAEVVNIFDDDDDPEAVESAVVKIQSTFRGKKVRSKLINKQKQQPGRANEASTGASGSTHNNPQQTADTATAPPPPPSSTTPLPPVSTKPVTQQSSKSTVGRSKHQEEQQLSKNLEDKMHFSDNQPGQGESGTATEDEAQKAATKIQAGFKGYKTRKELEGKLAGTPTAETKSTPSGGDGNNNK